MDVTEVSISNMTHSILVPKHQRKQRTHQRRAPGQNRVRTGHWWRPRVLGWRPWSIRSQNGGRGLAGNRLYPVEPSHAEQHADIQPDQT